jgi:hypothetical protein
MLLYVSIIFPYSTLYLRLLKKLKGPLFRKMHPELQAFAG